VVTRTGISPARSTTRGCFLLGFSTLAHNGHPARAGRVFTSGLGNILLVERRVLHYRIVLTCERGLLEDRHQPPPRPGDRDRPGADALGFGVVGRIDNGAFAVTVGTIEPWGLTNLAGDPRLADPTCSSCRACCAPCGRSDPGRTPTRSRRPAPGRVPAGRRGAQYLRHGTASLQRPFPRGGLAAVDRQVSLCPCCSAVACRRADQPTHQRPASP